MKILVLALLLTACPHPIPGGPTPIQHVVACGEEAIKGRGIELIPAINTCLVSGSATSCLLGLLNPAIGITEDVISCLVSGRGAEYGAAVRSNSTDSLSAKAEKNATQFLIDRQITIAP